MPIYMQGFEFEFWKYFVLYSITLICPSKRKGHRACAGQSRHKGPQVNKEAAVFLGCTITFIYRHFLQIVASQRLFWQVLFCKFNFILFLLRKSQGKRSPTGIFRTDASQTTGALKMILKIFSAVIYTKKNISTGNTWNINYSLLDTSNFLLFSMVCFIIINML